MVCLTFQNPHNSIQNRGDFLHKSKIISNPILHLRRNLSIKSISCSASSNPLIESAKQTKMAKGANEVMLTSGASAILSLCSLSLTSLWRLIAAFFLTLWLPFIRRCMAVGAAPESQKKGGGKDDKALVTTGRGLMRVPSTIVLRKSAAVDKEVAARRALAAMRVVEGNGDAGDKETVRDFSLFCSTRGDTIFTQSWTPVNVPVRGLVFILHGLNEHSGRYNDFAKKLNANGFKVYGMDWIGLEENIYQYRCHWCVKYHVRPSLINDGLHGYVHSLDYAVNDLKTFLSKGLAENPGLPCFCFGHSTGGAIILKAVLDPNIRECVHGIVLTSPAVEVQPSHPIFIVLAPIFSLLLPRLQFSAANKRGTTVSRDPLALAAKYSDPLVFTGSIRIRTGYEILRITTFLQQSLTRLTVPFLVLHGTSDLVTSPVGSQKLYDEASSTDKTIMLFEGLLHDLLFEPEKEDVMERIIEWLVKRL